MSASYDLLPTRAENRVNNLSLYLGSLHLIYSSKALKSGASQ
jgi:hypothetical protein